MMPGVWLWFDGSRVYFYPNGFVRGTDTAQWQCWGREVTITWRRGWIDHVVIDPRGYLNGFNQAGARIWAERKAGPGAL